MLEPWRPVPPLVVVLCAYAVRQHGHGGPGRFIKVGWFQAIFKWWVNSTEAQSTLDVFSGDPTRSKNMLELSRSCRSSWGYELKKPGSKAVGTKFQVTQSELN